MKIKTIKYFIRQSFRSLWRNRAMSIAAIGSVFAALLVIGLFLTVVLNVDYLATKLESQVEVKVYINDGLSSEVIDAMNKDIKELTGVKDCYFLSKDKALEEFNEQLGENSNLLDGLEGDNPLADSFVVTLDEPRMASNITAAISAMSNVENVVYGKEELEKLLNITHLLRISSLFIVVILVLISIFIISNTIKITVFARRKEVGIMKFVGATDSFVRGPFFVEGVLVGIIGSIISIVIISIGYYFSVQYVEQQTIGLISISLLPMSSIIYNLSTALLVIGIVIGALGSMISIRKFLKV